MELNHNNIKQLIEKYFNGLTSLEEEAQLQSYFNNSYVAEEFIHYKPLFNYYKSAPSEKFTNTLPLNSNKNKTKPYQWLAIAAIIILAIGLITPKLIGPSEAEKKEALLAYKQTKEALKILSIGINIGKNELNNLETVSNKLNQGIEHANQLAVFNTVTKKILKKNNTKN